MSTTGPSLRAGGLARRSVANSNMNFRASSALQSIQAFQAKNALGGGGDNTVKRASNSLGLDEDTPPDAAGLRIENERLKTTLMILNQKMKVQEDNEDLNEKWRA